MSNPEELNHNTEPNPAAESWEHLAEEVKSWPEASGDKSAELSGENLVDNLSVQLKNAENPRDFNEIIHGPLQKSIESCEDEATKERLLEIRAIANLRDCLFIYQARLDFNKTNPDKIGTSYGYDENGNVIMAGESKDEFIKHRTEGYKGLDKILEARRATYEFSHREEQSRNQARACKEDIASCIEQYGDY